jgi:predicted N-acetyltransferase YhbS
MVILQRGEGQKKCLNNSIMEVVIRNTEKSDFDQTENITREAFWNLYKPGCDEHMVLHNLRKSKCYISQLDLVAVFGGEIIGHIISTKARVIDFHSKVYEVLCVGPFAVLPGLQNKGVGTKLFEYSISETRKMGFKAMILFGNPDYYQRFGFENAQKYNITTKDGQNFDPFMALEIQENGLADVKGRFFEDEAFTTTENELMEFEKKFPPKEKSKAKIDLSLFE